MNHAKLSFIGGGNMGHSLVRGLLNDGYPAELITVSDINTDSRKRFADLPSLTVLDNNAEACKQANVLILAIKPQVLTATLEPLKESISPDCLIISIAAGIDCACIQNCLHHNQPIVRAMPNTPALINQGMAGLYANQKTSEQQRQLAQVILQAVGKTLWVEHEHLIDSVTAISGSGPAYVFLFMEALQAAAIKLGLEADAAKLLVQQTLHGAVNMSMVNDTELAQLRQQVTSPGGTTEAAINRFMQENFTTIIQQATEDAKSRAIEISKQYSEDS